MEFLFVLKQKDLELAAAEAKATAHGWGWWERKERPQHGTIILKARRAPREPRLGLTRRISRLLASGARGNIRSTLESIAWGRILKGKTFRVTLAKETSGPETERELATVIWRTLQSTAKAGTSPRVDLERPDVTIDIVLAGTSAHVGLRVWESDEGFENRRAHLRPELHPSSMHPAMARALVSIACARSIHDPFCGSGGILIEAGLAHKRASGADISPDMIARARKNCAALGLHPELRVADAVQWVPRAQAVIADLPYGKNTTPVALQPLLHAFLTRASQSTSRAVIGLPTAMPMPKGWRVCAHFTSYVHKSMTKHFYVLEKE